MRHGEHSSRFLALNTEPRGFDLAPACSFTRSGFSHGNLPTNLGDDFFKSPRRPKRFDILRRPKLRHRDFPSPHALFLVHPVYPFVYPGVKTSCHSLPLGAGFQMSWNPHGYLLHGSSHRFMPFCAVLCRFSVKQFHSLWGSRGRGFESRRPDQLEPPSAAEPVAASGQPSRSFRRGESQRRASRPAPAGSTPAVGAGFAPICKNRMTRFPSAIPGNSIR